jgi:hypothetical protein
VALVPAANGMAWWAIQRDRDAGFARYLSFGLGAALGVSIVYGIVFLPLAIPGIIALAVGIGLLPLTPYLALGSTIALRKVLKQRNESACTGEDSLRFYPGLLVVLGVFGLMHLSFVGTNSLIRMASDPSKEKTALTMLKYFGSEKTILEACYTSNRRLGPSLFWLLDASRVEEEQARKVYFQLYGRAYNTVPKTGPRMFTAWDARADWDPERGGEKVGAPVPQLSMVSSRIDATVEPNAALGYLEWIVEFNNAGFANAEARCEIELPPGATVSRLTLWINGEEREAAFAGKAHVREAYQNVVVVQRRDPVLVTTSGRDRIMMQCFPVQPQQRMKMRLGLTVPLLLDADKNGILRWPYILERNFALDDKLEHSFWIDSPMPIESLSIPLKLERSASGHYMARGTLNERSNEVVQPAVLIRRDPSIDQAWANDTRANDGSVVEQRIMERQAAAFRNIVLVLDGSLAMAKIAERLSDTPLPFTKPLQVVVAGPEVKQFIAANAGELKRELRKIRFNGGQDNIPALEKAWDLAADNGPGAVLWMHGPQPVTISGIEGLKQRFERRQNAVQLFDLPIERAPNVITQTLPPWVRVELVSMHRPPADVLAEVLAQLRGSRKHYEFVRAKSQGGSAGAESNLHLARLWAFDEIHRLARSGDHQRAVELAALYQLVTEVSGAVVLETAEQYKQAGLQPVSPNSVPVVPEPGTWALLIVGAIVLLAYQRRRRTALRA